MSCWYLTLIQIKTMKSHWKLTKKKLYATQNESKSSLIRFFSSAVCGAKGCVSIACVFVSWLKKQPARSHNRFALRPRGKAFSSFINIFLFVYYLKHHTRHRNYSIYFRVTHRYLAFRITSEQCSVLFILALAAHEWFNYYTSAPNLGFSFLRNHSERPFFCYTCHHKVTAYPSYVQPFYLFSVCISHSATLI